MDGFTHESSETDEWYTPPLIFRALNLDFDLDPAAPMRGLPAWIPALKHYNRADNGLVKPWDGRVWLNPPYGTKTLHWIRRFVAHGDGVLLVFARTDTEWFHVLAKDARVMCFLKGRIRFVNRLGRDGGTPGSGSLLVGVGPTCEHAVAHCGLGAVWDRR